jgi:hypothetical protein
MMLYDDEGTLMLALRSFTSGGVLYDQVRTLYGPLYYLYQIYPRWLLRIPLNHDTARALSASIWVLAAMVIFWIVYRATGSIAFSLVGHYLGFLALEFIGKEVLHPQEMCILVLLCLILAASAPRRVSIVVLGMLAAAIALTKLNLGIFVAVALGLVWVLTLPRGAVRSILLIPALSAAVAVPPLLMWAHIGEGWALRYALLICLSLIAAAVAAACRTIQPVPLWQGAASVLAGAATAAAICWPFLTRGSTFGGMYGSMVVWARGNFAQGRAAPLELSPAVVGWAVVSLVLAGLASTGRLHPIIVVCLKVGLAVAVYVCLSSYSFALLIGIGAPLLWLTTAVPAKDAGGSSDLLRPMLAIAGVLTVLYAYPVAGGQKQFACVLIAIAATLCLWDAAGWLLPRIARMARFVETAVLILACAIGLQWAYRSTTDYRDRTPLGLPGATWVRLDSDRVESLRLVVKESKSCSMLFGVPGLPSINLFSGVPAPKALSGFFSNDWMLFTSEEEQKAAVRELAAQPRPCAIFSQNIAGMWTNNDPLPRGPVLEYLTANFRTKLTTGDYMFMTPKDGRER